MQVYMQNMPKSIYGNGIELDSKPLVSSSNPGYHQWRPCGVTVLPEQSW